MVKMILGVDQKGTCEVVPEDIEKAVSLRRTRASLMLIYYRKNLVGYKFVSRMFCYNYWQFIDMLHVGTEKIK